MLFQNGARKVGTSVPYVVGSTPVQVLERDFNGMTDRLEKHRRLRAESQRGGGEKRIEAQHSKGKLTARERLWQAYRGAAMALVQTHLERQEPETALRYCYGLLAEDPCQEDVHRLAMRAHAALGNRSAVVRQFEHCKQLLAQELDVQPSPQTQSLYRKLVG